MRFFRPFVLSMLALALTAAGPDTFTRQDLEALEKEKTAAEKKLEQLQSSGRETVRDLETLDQDLLAAAAEALRREEQAVTAERSLIDLSLKREEASAQLLENEGAYEDLIAALAAANRRRPPALVVSPGQSGTAIRRALLMQATLPELNARAERISGEIAALNKLEDQIRTEQARLDAAEATIALKKEEIERLAATKRSQYEGLAGDVASLKARADKLGKEAATLRELLAALESDAPSAPGAKPKQRPQLAVLKPAPKSTKPSKSTPQKTVSKPLGKSALGGLIQPVSGSVTNRFGDKLPGGSTAEWIGFETRSEAQVVAPVSGTVEYARPFRSYGSMLILRTSDGYNVILTGMSKIYVSEGQSVTAGEPVGLMPDRTDPPPELTLELRLGDRVLNPAEWMARGG
ncbi:peptidoglycan DD-metalloendopeptidase family protein [Hyphomonas sp. WL0036]|uniref:murein hydrolase activator EnvC family protein n=1 Tax=Hyphomonas sediminis TaxID=2866160 RepID=UPI001C7E23AF|nr:peptidoglycan DD-metalloendopeptidase family protein [Hyphomonas sediminis]MBY9066354.1 peptidoglycan DD-metalloendopeptidase family protein [Hyphomonas sediminis]